MDARTQTTEIAGAMRPVQRDHKQLLLLLSPLKRLLNWLLEYAADGAAEGGGRSTDVALLRALLACLHFAWGTAEAKCTQWTIKSGSLFLTITLA